MTAANLKAAIAQAFAAEKAWEHELKRVHPRLVNARYLPEGKGEPGTMLAALHAFYADASAAMHRAFEAKRAADANRRPLPRLVAAMRKAGHSENEALSAIRARRLGDDFAAAESICACGGAAKVIRHAMRVARLYRGIPA